MNRIKKLSFKDFLVAGITFFGFVNHSRAYDSTPALNYALYEVHEKETISDILYSLNIAPIYGSNGALLKTVSLNPSVREELGDKVYPGQILKLPLTAEVNQKELAAHSVGQNEEAPPAPKVPVQKEFMLVPVERKKKSTIAHHVDPVIPNRRKTGRSPASDYSMEETAEANLSIGVGMRYFRIDGVDSATGDQASVLSGATPVAQVGFHVFWNKKLSFHTGMHFQQYTLQSLNLGQSFAKDSGTLYGFYMGGNYQVTQPFSIGASVKSDQDLFFQAKSTTVLQTNSVSILKPTLSAHYDVFQRKNAAIGFDGEASYLAPADLGIYKVKSGTAMGVGAHMQYCSKVDDEHWKSLEAQVYYSIENQNQSTTTHSSKNLNFRLDYQWRLNW